MTKIPTFIIAGAGKSGTTSLWRYLKAHPDICMARIKDPRFFTRIKGIDKGGGEDAPSRSGRFEKGFEWYENLFDDCQARRVFGEASTIYMYSEDSPRLMQENVPWVKIIFVLREPVGRLYSQYWQEKKTGRDLPGFEEMVKQNHPRFQRYRENSSYKKHLQKYMDCFPQEQILILLYDDLKQNAINTIRKTYDFIGVQADFVPANIHQKYNVAAQPRSVWAQRIIRSLSNNTLKEKLNGTLIHFLKACKQYLVKYNMVSYAYKPMPDSLYSELVELFREDVEYIESLLKVSLDTWKPPSISNIRQDVEICR